MRYTTYLTKEIYRELTKRGADELLLVQLAKAIEDIPKKKALPVDTSDNGISCLGYPVSFLRNHRTREIWCFTYGEALSLDAKSGKVDVEIITLL